MAVEYLTTSTNEFLNLQSGLARPYWEVNYTISATASTDSGTLGGAYQTGNDIVSFGSIDKEKSVFISGTDKLYAGDMTVKLNNATSRYSPLNSLSILYNKDWFNSQLKIWVGFYNVSGTALVVQKGTFLVEELEIDSENALAYLRCKDKLKYGLEKYIGLPFASGTSNARLWTGTVSSKAIITDLLSGVGLTAGDYDITAGIDFNNLLVSAKTVGWVLGKMAQASEGYMFVDNFGKVRFRRLTDDFGYVRQTWSLNTNNNILKTKYTISVANLINEMGLRFEESLSSYASLERTATTPKGRVFQTDNQLVKTYAVAQSVISRNLDNYDQDITFLEIDNLWYPAVELGDYFNITDPNVYMSGVASHTFELYKIREDINNLNQKLYLKEVEIGLKIGYLSDTGLSPTSVTFSNTGSGNWLDQYCFLGRDTGTAINPGFDEGTHSGAGNNVIDNSGIPEVSIEQPFVLG